jgi:hypothetical protein
MALHSPRTAKIGQWRSRRPTRARRSHPPRPCEDASTPPKRPIFLVLNTPANFVARRQRDGSTLSAYARRLVWRRCQLCMKRRALRWPMCNCWAILGDRIDRARAIRVEHRPGHAALALVGRLGGNSFALSASRRPRSVAGASSSQSSKAVRLRVGQFISPALPALPVRSDRHAPPTRRS